MATCRLRCRLQQDHSMMLAAVKGSEGSGRGRAEVLICCCFPSPAKSTLKAQAGNPDSPNYVKQTADTNNSFSSSCHSKQLTQRCSLLSCFNIFSGQQRSKAFSKFFQTCLSVPVPYCVLLTARADHRVGRKGRMLPQLASASVLSHIANAACVGALHQGSVSSVGVPVCPDWTARNPSPAALPYGPGSCLWSVPGLFQSLLDAAGAAGASWEPQNTAAAWRITAGQPAKSCTQQHLIRPPSSPSHLSVLILE